MRKINILITLFVFGLAIALPALAAPNINDLTGQVAAQAGYDTMVSAGDFSIMIGKMVRTVLSFVGVIFLVLTVYAGILWMTASGNEEQVGKAIKIIKAAAIGMAIALSAFSISAAVISVTNPKFATANASTGGGSCYLGDWQRDASSSGVKDSSGNIVGNEAMNKGTSSAWNKATYDGICLLKNTARSLAGFGCGLLDIVTLGGTNLSQKCSGDWGAGSKK